MFRSSAKSSVSCIVVGALVAASGYVIASGAQAAAAEPAALPETVSADALPTWQIDGIVWDQVTVGNTVYATGSFGKARPPGAAVGAASSVVRQNLLAYDITTGNLVTSFDHKLNGVGRTITASPDGSRVYVGGDFTKVDGISHPYVAAFDSASGTLDASFTGGTDASVRAVAASNSRVYVGGGFATANGSPAVRLAALSSTTGATLPFSVGANADVTAMTMAPDMSRVVVAGRFTKLSGKGLYGIGAVDATSGAATAWDPNFPVRDAGTQAAITDLTTSGDLVFGTAYDFGTGGNFEGRFAVDPYTGKLAWLDSCHGDSYSLYVQGPIVYSAGHAHDCSDTSSFDQQTNPARAQAETAYATGIAAHNNDTGNANYHEFADHPTSTILPWSPVFTVGSVSGDNQAAWSVTGNSSYVAYGGEFPTVNGVAQQGLVRFAVRSLAPNKVKAVSRGSFTPQASSAVAGVVRVRWVATYDADSPNLTYQLYRDDDPTPIYTTTAYSEFYQQPNLAFTDVGLAPGSTHTYSVRVSDSSGNGFKSFASNSVTVAGAGARTAYETAVTGDGAAHFWPLSETSGTLLSDHVSGNDLALLSVSDVTRSVSGPPAAGATPATTFSGSETAEAATVSGAIVRPTVSVEAWVKTTTTAGGQVVAYGLSNSRASAIGTNTIYLSDDGRPNFTVWTDSGYKSIRGGSAVNDGEWHLLAGTLSPTAGASLLVDGGPVASDASITNARQILGYWKVGGDRTKWMPNAPTSANLAGTIADVAVYPFVMTPTMAAAHAAGRGVSNAGPTAAVTQSCVALSCSFDGRGSTDADGRVASWSWEFGDGSRASSSTPTHVFDAAGTYVVALTVTDDDGAVARKTTSVTVQPNQAPTAAFTSSCSTSTCSFDASGSSDPDGPVVSYNWDFGDGGAATGKTTTHKFGANGDYPVTLIVADNGSPALTGTTTRTVTTSPAPNPDVLANDRFERTVSNGLGTADTGGAWTNGYGASTLGVSGGTAKLYNTAAGSSAGATLNSVRKVNTDTGATFSLDKATTGSGTFVFLTGRRISGTATYRARVRVTTNGALRLALVKLDGSTSDQVLGAETDAGITAAVGQQFRVRLQALGTSPTTLRAKVWLAAQAEPASWNVTATDAGAGLQQAGSIGLASYVFGNATNAPQVVSVDNFTSAPVVPAAAIATPSCSQLSCSFTSSVSTPSGPFSYAWTFGDGSSATGANASHTYSEGGTYRATLTTTDADGNTDVETAVVRLNKPPAAQFSASCLSGLTCSVDGSASSDPDGSVVSASWDFGDGTTAVGKTPSPHTYDARGTYTIALTVIDDSGGQNTVTRTVTVPPPNSLPTASFTATCASLSCQTNGSASKDTDGTIATYSWDWGDGTAKSAGASPTHVYAVPGNYPITLTVTDNSGGTAAKTTTVTATTPPNKVEAASDTFNRSVDNGFGTSTSGSGWTASQLASDISVRPGAGSINLSAAKKIAGAYLNSGASIDNDVVGTVSLNKVGTGAGTQILVAGRRISSTTEYRGRIKLLSNNQMLVSILRQSPDDGGGAVLAADTLLPLRYTAGMALNVRLSVVGTSPTRMTFTVWKSGTTEPAAQVSASDSAAALQKPGLAGIQMYVPADATNLPVTGSVTSWAVRRSNNAPVPTFTVACPTVNGAVTCTADGSGSSDVEGPIVNYAWSFGDGSSAAGAAQTSTHAYQTSGSYTITLTVTDSGGFTSSTTRTITVKRPPIPSFTTSCTGLTCTFDGTSTSDPDGTVSAYDWDFGDGFTSSGGSVTHTFADAADYTVRLDATSTSGQQGSASQVVVLSTGNKAPKAAFVVTCADLDCTFDGSGSTDPDGSVVAWAWDFGDGATDSGKITQHHYASATRVTAKLTVTDNAGAQTVATYVVQVRQPNVLPTASFTASCTPSRVCSFDSSGSSDQDGSIVGWKWDFGDGTTGTDPSDTRTYTSSAAVTVKLTITDNAGGTATSTQTITPGAP